MIRTIDREVLIRYISQVRNTCINEDCWFLCQLFVYTPRCVHWETVKTKMKCRLTRHSIVKDMQLYFEIITCATVPSSLYQNNKQKLAYRLFCRYFLHLVRTVRDASLSVNLGFQDNKPKGNEMKWLILNSHQEI